MIWRDSGLDRSKRGFWPLVVLTVVAACICVSLFVGTNSSRAATADAALTQTVSCMANPLGVAAPYNEFIATNGTRGSESEGAIAYGGNLTESSMTIGSRLASAKTFPSVVVDGTSSSGFNIQSGSAYLPHLASGSNVNFNGGGTYLTTAPINFTSAFATLEQNSATWAAATANGTYAVIAPGADGTPAMGGTASLLLSASDPTLDIFTVPASAFDNTSLGQIFINVPTGATALINVTGTSATFPVGVEYWNGSSYGQADNFQENTTGNAVEDTVWNFPQATGTITLATGSAWGGTIVAPYADVDATSVGHNDGAVIANSFESNFETHDYLLPSTACLPAAAAVVTPPPPPVVQSADLQLTKSANVPTVTAGNDVTYTVKVANTGAGSASNVVISDLLPAGMTFVSASQGCTSSGESVSCNAGTVASGASASFQIQAQADSINAPAVDVNDQITAVKQEGYISIPAGQTSTTDLSCGAGMIATDASVNVVHVDQGTGTLAQVQVQSLQLQPDGSYQAVVDNSTTGQAQAEMYLACINATTTDGHAVLVGDNVTKTSALTSGTHTILVKCGSGRTPISPSFAVLSGGATLDGSVPVDSSDTGFTVDVGSAGATVLAGMRCMSDTTGEAAGTVTELETNIVSEQVTVPAGQDVPEQLSCGDDQKGIVGGWNFHGDGLVSLGSEPQPKIRVFWVDNPTSTPLTGTLYLVCLDEHTGAASGQATIVNTAYATTSSNQTSDSVDSASATVSVTSSSSGGGSGTSDPVIVVDPPSVNLALTLNPNAAVALRNNELLIPLKVTGSASGKVALRTPHALHLNDREVKARGLISRSSFKISKAGGRRVHVALSSQVRKAMKAAGRTRLNLVLSGVVRGHERHVVVHLQVG